MKSYEQYNFLTQEEIEKLIDISFDEIKEYLKPFVEFKGIILSENKPLYVEGVFLIKDSEYYEPELTREQIENDYHLCEPDIHTPHILNSIVGTPSCNKPKLEHELLTLKQPVEIKQVYFAHYSLCKVMKALGAPRPKKIDELSKKNYTYNVKLINQKSNFTLNDAAKIAANIDINGFPPPSSLANHYKELLSDCIKGTNQDNFKLHTVELWCSYYDECGERYSKSYDNGTYLKQKAELDYELTIISKREFIRWCEYEDVDTGLTYELKAFDESIEALKAENEKLKVQIRPQRFQQVPLVKPDNKSNEKVQQLNKEIEQLTEELDLLKERAFPVMTLKLRTILEAQKEFWVDYNKAQPPSQQIIINHLTEQLGLKMSSNGPNRTAAELAKAIQPDEIKRK